MKALEEKIHKMIFSGIKDFSIVSHTPDILTENIIDVSKEIKDIAIEFAEWLKTEEIDKYKHRYSIFFDQFIEERNATP